MPPLTPLTPLTRIRPLTASLLLLLTVAMLLAVAAEKKQELKSAVGLPEDIVQALGGEERYLTHLSTDKPLYREGETLYARGVILDAHDRKPLPEDQRAMATFEIVGPKGDTIASGQTASEKAVLGVSWKVPEGTPGGEYTLKISYPWQGHAPAQRKFDIRAYRAPRLKTQIVFLRDGYGPGDTVQASVDIKRAEGGVPEGAKVTAVARVDGEEVARVPAAMNEEGVASAKFDLPDKMDRGEGTLAFIIEDGGVTETATKTLPILLQTLDIQFYPEGGDLIAGLANRVYFEARTPWGDPADLKGTIIEKMEEAPGAAASAVVRGDQGVKPLAEIMTVHEGRGRFEFKPAAGKQYVLKIDTPTGIERTFDLPAVKDQGVVMSSDAATFSAGEPVELRVQSSAGMSLDQMRVTLRKREREVATGTFGSGPNLSGIEPTAKGARLGLSRLAPPADVSGILIATVWDKEGKPLAERLIYREPAHRINVSVEQDIEGGEGYYPGAKPKLTVRTTDEDGKPVAATVGVTVTDDSVLEMIDKRDQAPRLPAMALLESDVKELRAPHAYLADEPFEEAGKRVDPDIALDLLLGTQGWRRFAFVDPVAFIKEHGDEGRRVLAARVVTQREVLRMERRRGGRFDLAEADRAVWDAVGAMPQAGVEAADDEGAEAPDAAPPAPAVVPARVRDMPEDKAVAEREPMPQQDPAAEGEGRGGPGLNRVGDRRQAQPAEQNEMAQALDEAQGIAAGEMLMGDMDMEAKRQVRNDFTPVRIYAHDLLPDRRPNDRTDFTETVYWAADVTTDDKGEASVEFALSDSVTGFRVLADAFDARGAVGAGDKLIESVEPFYVEPKLPLMVTQGDVIQLGVTASNTTDDAMPLRNLGVSVDGEAQKSDDELSPLTARSSERFRFPIDVTKPGTFDVVVTAATDSYSDKVTRTLSVAPRGFPISLAFGGLVGPASRAVPGPGVGEDADEDRPRGRAGSLVKHTFTVPDTVVVGSLTTEAAVYPTPLANMTEALARLVQEPGGCFEQTSSTAYPMVMAQQYFMTHQGVDPALVARATEMLDRGYKKLTSFETEKNGYEWFGSTPPHEALTAYGLMEFTDMAQVREVDPAMMQRTREFLLSRRDGKGGFELDKKALDGFGRAPAETTNAYIIWTLKESGQAELDEELTYAQNLAKESNDPYIVALAANALALDGRHDAAAPLMEKLAKAQNAEGKVEGATTSITRSGGVALDVETTSLAVLAWLKEEGKPHAGNVEKAMKWIAENCESGRFGSTQSTVLALKAIVEYDKSRATPKADGDVQLFLDGKAVGTPIAFTPETQGAIELPDFGDELKPGEHTVELRMTDGSEMPYSLTIGYHAVQPDNADQCALRLTTTLSNAKVEEGGITEANVSVTNTSDELAPMPVALIGLPGGLEVSHDRLKELVEQETIAAYEVLGRDVVLYWRKLDAKQTVELKLSLVAAVPGTYTGPASRAYVYYTDEFKQWQPGLEVNITPRGE